MNILDILLLAAGCSAWVFSFLSWNDSLHKLFLGIIIGFLMYALVSTQIDLALALNQAELNSYQNFILSHATGILSFMLTFVPVLWVLCMLSTRLKIETKARNFSHLLLGLLLPIFLIGILSFLGDGSLLAESPTWMRVFGFFETSSIYKIFQTLPWAIFALLAFLVFYKTFFMVCLNFSIWLYHQVFMEFFKSWKDERKKIAAAQKSQTAMEEIE